MQKGIMTECTNNDNVVGNEHVLIAVLCGVVASLIITPIGGIVVFAVIFSIGQRSKNASLQMLAEMRKADEEENNE